MEATNLRSFLLPSPRCHRLPDRQPSQRVSFSQAFWGLKAPVRAGTRRYLYL
jgi:hypothetical protein